MALEKTIVPVAFGQGIDRGSDPKLVQQKLLGLKNGTFRLGGTIRKRNGSGVYVGNNSRRFLAKQNNKVISYDDGELKYLDETVAVNTSNAFSSAYYPRLAKVEPRKTLTPATDGGTTYLNRSTLQWAEDATYFAVSYYNGSVCYVRIFNKTSLEETYSTSVAAPCVKLVTSNGIIYAIFQLTAGGNILVRPVVAGSLSMPADTGYAHAASTLFDACAIGATSSDVISVVYIGAANKMHHLRITSGTSFSDDIVNNGAGADITFTCPTTSFIHVEKYYDNLCWILWSDNHYPNPGGGNVYTLISHYTSAITVVPPITIANTATQEPFARNATMARSLGAGGKDVIYMSFLSRVSSIDYAEVYRTLYTVTWTVPYLSGTAAASSGATVIPGAQLRSRIFSMSEKSSSVPHLLVQNYHGDNLANEIGSLCVYRVDHTTAANTKPCARLSTGLAPISFASGNIEQEMIWPAPLVSTNTAQFCSVELLDTSITTETTVKLYRLSRGTALTRLAARELQDVALIPGSLPWIFDGAAVEPACPGPGLAGASITDTITGGAAPLAAGVYGFYFTLQWRDNMGHLHESAPSLAGSVTASAPFDQFDIVVTPPLFAPSNSVICVYRTACNGNVYYLATSQAYSAATYISITSTLIDASLTSQKMLYTTGGVLENDPIRPFAVSCVHQNRHFLVDADNPAERVYYSKAFEAGVAAEYSDFLVLTVPADGGNITALASFMDRLLVFKQNVIYAVSGDGPAANGAGSTYSQPFLVSSPLGCIEQKTVVNVPQGLMFLSDNGFRLLDRSMQLQDVGRDLKAATDSHTFRDSISCGAVIPEKEYVIFCSDTAAAAGAEDNTGLVFNYNYGQWSSFTFHEATDAIEKGSLYRSSPTLGIMQVGEVASQFADYYAGSGEVGGAQFLCYEFAVDTGWFNFVGPLGWQRIYEAAIMGQAIAAHTLRILVAYDYDPLWAEEQLYRSSDAGYYHDTDKQYTMGEDASRLFSSYLLSLATARGKCTAVRFRISDAPLGTATGINKSQDDCLAMWRFDGAAGASISDESGRGYALSLVGASVAMAQGLFLIPSRASVGALSATVSSPSGYYRLATAAALKLQTFSLRGWVYYDGTMTPQRQFIFCHDSSVKAGCVFLGIGQSTAYLEFTLYFTNNTTLTVSTSPTPLATGWHYIVAEASPTVALLLVDGVSAGVGAVAGRTIDYTNANYIYVGCDPNVTATEGNFHGKIDELALFSTAISTAQLAKDMTVNVLPATDTFTVSGMALTVGHKGRLYMPGTTRKV